MEKFGLWLNLSRQQLRRAQPVSDGNLASGHGRLSDAWYDALGPLEEQVPAARADDEEARAQRMAWERFTR